jgi:hypothetical protein
MDEKMSYDASRAGCDREKTLMERQHLIYSIFADIL